MADMSKIMAALGGFGAGYQGQGAQYLQGLENQKLMQQEQEARTQQLEERRKAAMVQDAWTVNKLLDENKIPVALKLLDNRIENIQKLKGDPSDTMAIKEALVSGDPARVAQAKQELQLFSEAGIAAGAWSPPQESLDAKRFAAQQEQFNKEMEFKEKELNWKKTRPISEAEGGATAPAKNLATYERLLREGNPNAERFAYASGLAGRDIDSRVTLAQREADARAAGGTAGKDRAEASIDLPKIESSAAKVTGLVNELLTHKGKSAALGATSYLPSIRGTERAGFDNRLKQIQGDAFLKAFESLKGGGAITEIEGQKATQALNRMNETVSEEEFDLAAKDFLSEVNRFKEIAAQRAKGAPVKQDKQAKTGGVLHVDAAGNKAMVYPDGSYEEVN